MNLVRMLLLLAAALVAFFVAVAIVKLVVLAAVVLAIALGLTFVFRFAQAMLRPGVVPGPSPYSGEPVSPLSRPNVSVRR